MSEASLRVVNPYDDSIVAEIPRDDARSLEAKLTRVVKAQAQWRQLPVAERIARVAAALERMRAQEEQVALDVTLQMGKPLAQSHAEIAGFFERAEHMQEIAAEALSPAVLPAREGFERRIEHEPLGVVFVLAAWNYPLLIPVNTVVPALLAGNGVLLKHSAVTPLCASAIVAAFAAMEPAGLVEEVVASHSQAAALIQDARVSHVSFTGSVAGGRAVQQAAADRFIDVGLELGGKDPAYVAADADLEFTVQNLVDGACYNAGQSCCAIERVYVHASRYGDFVDRARALLEAYVTGDPRGAATTLGPMAQRSAVAFLTEQVAEARRQGARLITGGTAIEDRFFAPTLLADCDDSCQVMREESFGPLLPVRAVAGDAEALAAMNASRFGLTASVWTRDAGRAEHFGRQLEAGTIFQNRCDYLDPGLAWTGVKDSGKGTTLSRFGFLHLTRRKSLHFRR